MVSTLNQGVRRIGTGQYGSRASPLQSTGLHQGSRQAYVKNEAAEQIIEIFGTKQLLKQMALVDGIVTIVFLHDLKWQYSIPAIPSRVENDFLLE